jgi:hypothetical protein
LNLIIDGVRYIRLNTAQVREKKTGSHGLSPPFEHCCGASVGSAFFLVKNRTKRYIQGGKTVLYFAKYNARLALVWPGNQSPGSSDT